MRRYTLSKSGYCTVFIHNHTVYSLYIICYISVSPVTYRPYVYCVTDFHTRLQTIYTSIYFILNINILRNIHIYILYTQDTYLFIYIRPFQIHAIWRSVHPLYSINTHNCNTVHHKLYILNQVTVQYQYTNMQYNTSLLYRTTINMYIVYTCIYTLHTQEFTHYLYIHLRHITVHCTFSDTTVQHNSCTLRLNALDPTVWALR